MNKISNVKLSNGIKLPSIGFGTWQIPNGEICYNATLEAFRAGYTHIDTAYVYGNEESVGQAFKDSGLNRNDVFITTKLPANIKGYDEAIEMMDKSLKNLNLDYVDLYLIHAPKPWDVKTDGMEYMDQNIATWKAFERLYDESKTKAIGVSNFSKKHLEVLLKETEIIPMVNQIVIHPLYYDIETIKYCFDNGIVVEAYSPFATGKIFDNEVLAQLATKYNKSIAQICLRWSLDKGYVPLPKSITASRIHENLDVFDFVLTKEDIELIDSLNTFNQ